MVLAGGFEPPAAIIAGDLNLMLCSWAIAPSSGSSYVGTAAYVAFITTRFVLDYVHTHYKYLNIFSHMKAIQKS